MNLQKKIFAGLLFLLGLSILITGIAAFSIRKLANDAQKILKNNYNTLIYSKDMLKALNSSQTSDSLSIRNFEISLRSQENNITEVGEKELTENLTLLFTSLKNDLSDKRKTEKINEVLFRIMELNMHAIEKRNNTALQTADQVFLILICAGGLFLTIAVIFIAKFPSYVAVPVMKRDVDKTHLIETVSHEIKTPIASIKLSTKLLEDTRVGNLNPEQLQLITAIKEDTNRVLKIAETILNMAQMESGKIQMNLQPAEPEKILNYAVEATTPQASQKHIRIEVHCKPGLAKANADMEKTAWVLMNLLYNAIRFSSEHSTIYVKAEENENWIEFSVADTGKGIDPLYKEKIFERYFQVPGSDKKGTGLGLAISKEFILAQGGDISVLSEVGKGSKFRFTLPIHFLSEISI